MTKTTPFGRAIRKLRVDSGETLGDISNSFRMSVAMLSAIETGRKNVPNNFIAKVKEHFSLRSEQVKELKELAELSKTDIKIGLKGAGDLDRELVASFARQFPSLGPEEKKKLKKILEKNKK